MASSAKTLIATGVSSGLGFELIKQLLEQPQAYRFLMGVRDLSKARKDFDALKFDDKRHHISLFKCDCSNLKEVSTFANDALKELGRDNLDIVMLGAAHIKDANGPGPSTAPRFCESQVVNHLSGHYLLHLLREKIIESRSRVVVVSSGAVRIESLDRLKEDLLADSGAGAKDIYPKSKFTQLLGAHYWKRQFGDRAEVVAVSPGLIPGTGLARHTGRPLPTDHPDAKSIPEGARNILRAFTISDVPKDPDTIFLTSWGEWWDPQKIHPLSLDSKLQDEWCPSREEIEREAKL